MQLLARFCTKWEGGGHSGAVDFKSGKLSFLRNLVINCFILIALSVPAK